MDLNSISLVCKQKVTKRLCRDCRRRYALEEILMMLVKGAALGFYSEIHRGRIELRRGFVEIFGRRWRF
jgi:hypothetical protein